ncbi:MAG: type II toxin-antitoxin system HicA family toxin [Candidatus Paceibacterota bacterium]
MPNKLKTSISGKEVIKFFESYGFVVARTQSSHVIIKRIIDGHKQVLVIPNHKIVLKGTLKAIVNQSAQYISLDELHSFFYTE